MYYVVHTMDETKVTRRYQITIPKSIRKRLRIRIGDRLPIASEKGKIVIEVGSNVTDPTAYLWGLSKRKANIDAVELVRRTRRGVRH